MGFSWFLGRILKAILILLFGFTLRGQPSNLARQDFWIPDGPVFSAVETNGVLYLGGAFTNIAPNGGRGGLYNIYSAEPTPLFPQVNGAILSVSPDGGGGWFIGGLFNQIGGVARTNLAHVRSDLSVDTNWTADPFGLVNVSQRSGVYSLLLNSNVLYVGGIFTKISGVPRSNLAALDASTGAALGWNADVTGEVYCLGARNSSLYVGGRFSAVKGVARNSGAAVDLVSGSLLPWNPNAPVGVYYSLNAIAVDEDVVYAGGYFTQLGGLARTNLAALDPLTGVATAWNPGAAGNPDLGQGVQALALTCSTLYVGGVFSSIGGVARNNIAALDSQSATVTSWNPNADDLVLALIAAGNTVYAGGKFVTIGGGAHNSVAALDVNTATAADWSPRCDRGVTALALASDSLFIGGGLSAGGVSRRNIAALDTRTGDPLDWNPGADGPVFALAVSDSTVYAGGRFAHIGGLPRIDLAAINRTNGAVLSWQADISDPLGVWLPSFLAVFTLQIGNNALYVGGAFTALGGTTRGNAGSLNLTNASVNSWYPAVYGAVGALAIATNTVYLGGNFTNIDNPFPFVHFPRKNIAEVNATSGAPTTWNPGANDTVTALALSSNVVYAGGYFMQIGSSNRNLAAAIDRSTALATAWNPNLTSGIDPTVYSIATSSNLIYLGGGFDTANGQPRLGLAAVNTTNGALDAFDAQLGDLRATVHSLVLRGSHLFCCGFFLTVADEVRLALAEFVEAGYPRFLTQPTAQTVDFTSSFTLQATATGQSPLRYQWQLNETNIVGATNNSLSVSNLQPSTAGLYRVVVTNSLGQATSLEVPVTILYPPAIFQQPSGQTNAPGTNLVLTVGVIATPPPVYQWRRNGVNIPGAVRSSLSISNAQPADSGAYDVLGENVLGEIRSTLTEILITSPTLPFADNLANITFTNAASGVGSGSTLNATKELGETNHVGKVGGKSVWFGWTAISNGVATFNTRGSEFDTLLAVYTGASISNLVPVAADDDSGPFHTSIVSFNAQAGTNYLVVIDGLNGASGDVVLTWNRSSSSAQIPQFLAQPTSLSVFTGDTATFNAVASGASTYQWYHECRPVRGATNTSLTVTNVQPRDVGQYTLWVWNAATQLVVSVPAYLEITPVRQALTYDKLADLFAAAAAANQSPHPFDAFASVAAGVPGTQILNNFGSTTDQGEPTLCQVIGGASRWFQLTPSVNGVLGVDTVGSSVGTVIGLYTGSDVFSLHQIACDIKSAPDRVHSWIKANVEAGTKYIVQGDALNAADGNIRLNWILGTVPTSSGPPGTPVFAQGALVTLSAGVTNALPEPSYRWLYNGSLIVGATNSTYSLTNIQYAQQGTYSVIISNFAGVVTNVVAVVRVEIPFHLSLLNTSSTPVFQIVASSTQAVVLQSTTNFVAWSPVLTNTNFSLPLRYVRGLNTSPPHSFFRLLRWP